MSGQSRLEKANELLVAAYGMPKLPELRGDWKSFLQVLLVGPISHPAVADVLESPELAHPRFTAETGTHELVERLSPVPRGSQKAGVIRGVAQWWLSTFGDDEAPDWRHGREFYRDSLRKIRGLGPATVDELLLFVGNQSLFPIDRGTLRVAVRHGWIDLPVEDDDAQDFFRRGLRDARVDPLMFSRQIAQVASEHCGREPKCTNCPLQSLLPPNGPISPESC